MIWTALIISIHVVAAAAWMGSMFYSLVVLHPRARRHFGDLRQFEEFILTLADGARYPVLAAFAIIGATGLALLPAHAAEASRGWWILISAKIALFVAALALFLYASYWLWPRRIFATDAELPARHRQFRVMAIALTAIATAAIVSGVMAHVYE